MSDENPPPQASPQRPAAPLNSTHLLSSKPRPNHPAKAGSLKRLLVIVAAGNGCRRQ
jgi:hypothetical protein